MKPTIYMETSVVSYLAARPSKDPVISGQQIGTRRWWKEKRRDYEIYISKLVWQEAAEGDKVAAKRRLKFIASMPWLQITRAVTGLARTLIKRKAIPPNAGNDATHIAIGAVYQIQFLLTWNFSHINNPATEELVRTVCSDHDYHCPVICAPDQLLTI
jgi:hypothetical protein